MRFKNFLLGVILIYLVSSRLSLALSLLNSPVQTEIKPTQGNKDKMKPILKPPAQIFGIPGNFIEYRVGFWDDTPWDIIFSAIQSKWGQGLGEWEKALMGAIWFAEGGKDGEFGVPGKDLLDKAERCAVTIRNGIDRFWRYLSKLSLDSANFDPEEAGKFGRALIATTCLQYFRLGRDVASLFGFDPLTEHNLAKNYISLLNEGFEKITEGLPRRTAYLNFLIKFIADDCNEVISGSKPLPSGITDPYILVADSFYKKFISSSELEQFLIFSTFNLAYIGSGYGSGYCPLWDMRAREWIGAFQEHWGDFKLNSNWGMNVYSVLRYYFDFNPFLPFPLHHQSYFLSKKP